MPGDHRHDTASYYDQFSGFPLGDVEFYRAFVTPETRVLELGCGTGRVLGPLAGLAAYIHGLDHSPSMLALCQQKLDAANLGPDRAAAEAADITDFDLTGRMPPFDLITAPFRVMQNLETDAQVAGLMHSIRRHLAPGGTAILNTFRPVGGPAEIKAYWDARDGSKPAFIKPDGDGTVSMTDICTRYRDDPLTVFPDLIYRRFDAQGRQTAEDVLHIAMRVWYPDELVALIESHGFRVTQRHGGYLGQAWGEGPELVAVFQHAG